MTHRQLARLVDAHAKRMRGISTDLLISGEDLKDVMDRLLADLSRMTALAQVFDVQEVMNAEPRPWPT